MTHPTPRAAVMGGSPAPHGAAPLGPVLLTGATGFLGVHVLRELLDHGASTVTCLVRAPDDLAARQRLLERIAWYFPELAWSQYERRVRVVAGDVSAERLGLSVARYDELAAEHATIFNVAADVRHVGTLAQFLRANADSVLRLITFARSGAAKHLHHVSSVAVRGRFLRGLPIAAFTEEHLEQGQAFPDHPYAESKYRAELSLRQAFAEGLSGTVYRVGNVGPQRASGRFQQNIQSSDFACYLRACTTLGFAPYRPQLKVRLTQVDALARAIVTLARHDGCAGRTYHVDSPHELGHYDMMRVLHAFGYAIRLIDAAQFAEQALALAQDDEALAMMLPAPSLEQGEAAPIDASWSERELGRLGFTYPELSGAWLGKFLDHAIAREFLKAPRHWRPDSLVQELL